jgi:hypothetical protein
MKLIQIDLHFVRDQFQKGTLKMSHVHTQDQLATLLTKPLSRERTKSLQAKIDLADGSLILQGHIKEGDIKQESISNSQKTGSDLQQQPSLQSCLVS